MVLSIAVKIPTKAIIPKAIIISVRTALNKFERIDLRAKRIFSSKFIAKLII